MIQRLRIAGRAGVMLAGVGLAVVCGCAGLAGCAAPGPTGLSAGIRRLPAARFSDVVDAAKASLSEAGLRVDPESSDPEAGILRCIPLEDGRRAAALGGALRPWRGTRRVASVRVEGRDGEVRVYCRVEVQERSTEAGRFYATEHERSDLPGGTPIDRGAATTEEQNSFWRTVGRDRTLERAILGGITRRASVSVPSSEAPGAPTSAPTESSTAADHP